MRFEKSIEIAAPQQRVWDVLTDIEGWPRRIDTVETVELLTPAPLATGSRVRLRQPKLPEAVWEVTAWDPPVSFEWVQRATAMTIVAGHSVQALGADRSRLTLTIDMRGFLSPVMGRLSGALTDDYMTREAEGMKRAAESA